MRPVFIWILILTLGFQSSLYGQLSKLQKEVYTAKVKEVKKDFDVGNPGNKVGDVTKVYFKKHNKSLSPVLLHRYMDKVQYIKGERTFTMASAAHMEQFHKLKPTHQHLVKLWAEAIGAENPAALYQDILTYWILPHVLSKSAPNRKRMTDLSLFDTEKSIAVYTIAHMAKFKYLRKFGDFAKLVSAIQVTTKNLIGSEEYMVEIINADRPVEDFIQYWYLNSLIMIEAMGLIQTLHEEKKQ